MPYIYYGRIESGLVRRGPVPASECPPSQDHKAAVGCWLFWDAIHEARDPVNITFPLILLMHINKQKRQTLKM